MKNFKKWCRDWSVEITFSLIGIVASMFLVVTVWQSDMFQKGYIVDDDTHWYTATIVIHYPDKPKTINVSVCRLSEVQIGRGRNYVDYTDKNGYHVIKSIAPIEITNIKRIK